MSVQKRQVRQIFRQAVLQRDGLACLKCGRRRGITAHHITDRSEMPNGGYVPENGISLCRACHRQAEAFHETGEALLGFSQKDLYGLIGSSWNKAMAADGGVVCVRHRDGWCATGKKTLRYAESIKTICQHYVIATFGLEWRMPDCPDCLECLSKKG